MSAFLNGVPDTRQVQLFAATFSSCTASIEYT